MPLRRLFALIASLFAAGAAAAAPSETANFSDFGEQTILYTREQTPEADYPTVVLFDPEGYDAAIREGRPALLIVRFDFPDGELAMNRMPDGDAVNAMRRAFDDRLPRAFEQAGAEARLIGTRSGGAARSYWLMVDDPVRARAALERLRAVRGTRMSISQIADAQLEIKSQMAPTPAELETAKDDAVREQLAERGDDGRTPRHTLFYLYGGDIEGLATAARAAGYEVGPTAKNDGLILETTTAVDQASFAVHQRRMLEWQDRFGTDYDGWECAMLTN